jgi:multiple sugar transport system ATP-binding protein
VRQPQAFLMDEPLSSLDAKLRVHMRAEIGALHQRIGVTTVYVTHDQIEAMTMADRVVIMKDGAIQQIADPDTLFQHPDTLFVAGFIGSPGMNFLSAQVEQGARGPLLRLFGQEVPIAGRALGGATEVVAGLRPEHLFLGPGPVQFDVRPGLIESLGSEKYIYFDAGLHKRQRAGGEEDTSKGLIARVSHTGSLATQTGVTLSFDPANLYLFDTKTEMALR